MSFKPGDRVELVTEDHGYLCQDEWDNRLRVGAQGTVVRHKPSAKGLDGATVVVDGMEGEYPDGLYFYAEEVRTAPVSEPASGLTLNNYQTKALATAVYPSEAGLLYPALKLAGEAGEVAEKVGKMMRDTEYRPWNGDVPTIGDTEKLVKELGDVLWYTAACAKELGLTLEEVAERNLSKLASRQERGVIQGSGDER